MGAEPGRDVVLGADLGTSGLKLIALDGSGAVVAEAESGYAVARPAPDRAEGDVAAWRRAFDGASADVLPRLGGARVAAVGLAGQMHGAVLVDAAGLPVHPPVLWPDVRAAIETARWRELPPADRAGLANPLVPGMTGPVLAWFAAHRPEVLTAAAAVLLPKDALRAALLPAADPGVTDRSDASATLLWDVRTDDWSTAAVGAAGIPAALLPEVRPATAVAGVLGGPLDGVPVTVGGADTALALLAAGTSGVLVNLGTGAQVVAPLDRPVPADDPPVHCYAGALGGWYAMAALQNGGSAWAWVCGVLGLSWAELFGAAASVPPGAGGAVFTPFLTGERGGVARPEDRGGWTGLHPSTTRADLARAAVEGVTGAVAAAVRLLDVPDDGSAVVLTGGGARAAVVQQSLADALGRPVAHLRLRSASATGAAVLAGHAVDLAIEPERDTGPVVEPAGG
jgi:xylulokinase